MAKPAPMPAVRNSRFVIQASHLLSVVGEGEHV